MRHHAFFYALRFTRPYGTIVWFFPRVPGVPPGLRSNRPYGTIVWFFPRVPGVPPGLQSNRPYGTTVWFFPCPRSSSWTTVKPSLRDYRLVFSRVPGVPPGLRSNRPCGTTVWFFPVSQEFLLGYGQTVPTGLTCPSHDPMRGKETGEET